MSDKSVDVAAKMLSGSEKNAGLLHYDLYSRLQNLDSLCFPGLPGADAVAGVIVAWCMSNKDGENAIGEGGV
jgi:hypothetical protein